MADLAVTGSTGALGGRIARALADLGTAQRLIVRDAARAPRLDRAEVREVPGSYADPEGYREALAGVGTLFLVSAEETPDRVAQHTNAIEAAAAAGVERIVYTSFLGAAADSTFLLGRSLGDRGGDPRGRRRFHLPARLLSTFTSSPTSPGRSGPSAARPATVGSRPYRGTTSPRSRSRSSRLPALTTVTSTASPARSSFSLSEAAERLTAYTGEPYSYVEDTKEEAWASRRPSGAPDWMIEGWISTYTAIAEGSLDQLSATSRRSPAAFRRPSSRRSTPTPTCSPATSPADAGLAAGPPPADLPGAWTGRISATAYEDGPRVP